MFLVAKVVFFQDMTEGSERSTIGFPSIICKDRTYPHEVKITSAQLDGKMGVTGYWLAMELGFDYGTYTNCYNKKYATVYHWRIFRAT